MQWRPASHSPFQLTRCLTASLPHHPSDNIANFDTINVNFMNTCRLRTLLKLFESDLPGISATKPTTISLFILLKAAEAWENRQVGCPVRFTKTKRERE
jgi:hypothetical protein